MEFFDVLSARQSVRAFAPDDEAVRRVIGAPEGVVPVAMLPVGYAAERPPRRSRRPLSELVSEVEG